jgi:DNA polymerase III subunit beta
MKSVIINNELLKKALNRVKGIVDRKSVLPILDQIVLKATSAGISITATDLEVTVVVSLATESLSLDEFEILLPFELVYRISGLAGSTPFKISTDETMAIIECDNDKYELKTLENLNEYPKLPEIPVQQTIKVADDFPAWLNKSLSTISPDTLRPAMTKICLDIDKNSVSVVTTNASSMFIKRMQHASGPVTDQLLISPKVARALSGFEETEIFWNESQLAFKAEGLLIFATRCTEKFPVYKKVVPAIDASVEFDRMNLIHGLEKAALAADSSATIKFKLRETNGTVRLSSVDIDKNRNASIDIAADYSGECDVVAMSADRLIVLLNQIPFNTVGIAIKSPSSAVLIKSVEDEGYTGLIMPIMTN